MKRIASYINEALCPKEVFVVLKPGSLDLAQTIIERFAKDGWEMVRTITKTLLLQEAEELYKVHEKEPFYEDLCKYMSSGPCRAFIFCNPNSKKPFTEVKVIKDEIRKEYGESDMRNVLHSSDSQKAMEHEASIFFCMNESLMDDEELLIKNTDEFVDIYQTLINLFKKYKKGFDVMILQSLLECTMIKGDFVENVHDETGIDIEKDENWSKAEIYAFDTFFNTIFNSYDFDFILIDWSTSDDLNEDEFDYELYNKTFFNKISREDFQSIKNNLTGLDINIPYYGIDKCIAGWDGREEIGWFICSMKIMSLEERKVLNEMMKAITRGYK